MPMNVLHIGERNVGILFARILEVEGAACQEDEIAIEILGDSGAVGHQQPIKQLAAVRGNPARKLKLDCTPIARVIAKKT